MREFVEDNGNYIYFLIVIDILSKFRWAKPLKTKTGVEMACVFNKVFNEGGLQMSYNLMMAENFLINI